MTKLKSANNGHYTLGINQYGGLTGWVRRVDILRQDDRRLCAHCDYKTEHAVASEDYSPPMRRAYCTAPVKCATGSVLINEEAYLKGVVLGLWE